MWWLIWQQSYNEEKNLLDVRKHPTRPNGIFTNFTITTGGANDNRKNDNTNKKVDTADKKTTKTEAPKTGDTANIAMNVFVMAICGAAIVTVIFRKRFTRR